MSSFKTWLEFMGAQQPAPTAERPGFQTNKEDKVLRLWDQIFADLGYKGDPPSKTASKTLEELTETEPNQPSGKVVASRLRRVMQDLAEADPELAGTIPEAMKWLEEESSSDPGKAAPKKQFSDFLKKVFGEEKFMELLNRDPKSSDVTPSAPQPGAYAPDSGSAAPTGPPAPDMEPPMGPEMPPQQPQAPADQQLQQPPPVQNPPPPVGVGGPNHMSYW
jgi:hypothetical protein